MSASCRCFEYKDFRRLNIITIVYKSINMVTSDSTVAIKNFTQAMDTPVSWQLGEQQGKKVLRLKIDFPRNYQTLKKDWWRNIRNRYWNPRHQCSNAPENPIVNIKSFNFCLIPVYAQSDWVMNQNACWWWHPMFIPDWPHPDCHVMPIWAPDGTETRRPGSQSEPRSYFN